MTEGQVDKVSDFEEYEEAVYNADVTDDDYMSVAGDYVLKGTFNTTCKGQVVVKQEITIGEMAQLVQNQTGLQLI